MPLDFNNSGERYARRAKRRKTNIILNTLIAIVIILIIIVGSTTFFGGNKENQDLVGETGSPNNDTEQKDDTSKNDHHQNVGNEDKPADDEVVKEPDNENNETVAEDEEPIETESGEPNVEKVIINPSWAPIGTVQMGNHESSWSKGTVDWNEKLQAAAYAVGIPVENMTAWWVTRGENPENQAVLTVSEKGGADAYRVYIDWVDGEGWVPTEVKKLIENDRKSS